MNFGSKRKAEKCWEDTGLEEINKERCRTGGFLSLPVLLVSTVPTCCCMLLVSLENLKVNHLCICNSEVKQSFKNGFTFPLEALMSKISHWNFKILKLSSLAIMFVLGKQLWEIQPMESFQRFYPLWLIIPMLLTICCKRLNFEWNTNYC